MAHLDTQKTQLQESVSDPEISIQFTIYQHLLVTANPVLGRKAEHTELATNPEAAADVSKICPVAFLTVLRQEGGGGILPACNTYTPATGGTEGDESYMRHAVGEGFLVVPCPRALTFTAEEPHRLAERAKGDCYTNRAHKTQELIVWLKSAYSTDNKGSLPKEDVYVDYLNFCVMSDKEPLSKAMLGKILHQAFPNIACNRLGPRGHTKHCYKGLQRKPLGGDVPWQSMPAAVPDTTSVTPVLPSYVEVSAAISMGTGVGADVRARPAKRVKVARGEDRLPSGSSSASRRYYGEDEESDADDESDYEQLEAPEHSSEGNQTSDWEGDASDCHSYAEHAREIESAQRRQEAQPDFQPAPNRVSDSLLHFLRASPNRGPSCCGCGQVEGSSPSVNPPPYISLLQAHHPLQGGYYPHSHAGHPSQPLYYPSSHPPLMGHQLQTQPSLPPIFAPIHFTAAPPSGIKSLLPAQRNQPGRPVGY